MATLLEAFAQQLNARQSEQLAKLLNVKTEALRQGMDTAGALLLGAVHLQTATPEGAGDLLASLNGDKDLRTDAMEAIAAGHGYPILDFLFGVGYPKVTAWVKDTAGVEVEPFLAPAAVLMMRALEDAALAEKFDVEPLAEFHCVIPVDIHHGRIVGLIDAPIFPVVLGQAFERLFHGIPAPSPHIVALGVRFILRGADKLREFAFRHLVSAEIKGARDRHLVAWDFVVVIRPGSIAQFFGNRESDLNFGR